MAKPKPQQRQSTSAVHLQHGNRDIVGLKNLRVLLSPDGAGWFAQGLDIDYAASGATVEEAKENFGTGLVLTVAEHLRMYGGIQRLLKVAPQEAWTEYLTASPDAIKAQYSQFSSFESVEQTAEDETAAATLPFAGIEFFAARDHA